MLAWQSNKNRFGTRIMSIKGYYKGKFKRRLSSAAAMRMIRNYDAEQRVNNALSLMMAAVNEYRSMPSVASANKLKVAIKTILALGSNPRTTFGRTLRRGGSARGLMNKAKAYLLKQASPELAKAFAAGHARPDKGGFVDAIVSIAPIAAVALAPVAITAIATTFAAAAAAAGAAGSAGGVGASVASTSAQIAGITTAAEASQIVAGQALANSIGAGLTGAAAQSAAVTAITTAGIPAAQAAAAVAAVPALAAGTAAASGLVSTAVEVAKDRVGSVIKKELSRINAQAANLATPEGAASAAIDKGIELAAGAASAAALSQIEKIMPAKPATPAHQATTQEAPASTRAEPATITAPPQHETTVTKKQNGAAIVATVLTLASLFS